MTIDPRDRRAVALQLSREPRAVRDVAHRCGCGLPDVVETNSRLEDGTPFPTLYYLTCPRAAALIGTLESSGLMAQMTARLAEDPELQAAYTAASEAYVATRDTHGVLENVPAQGGMPTRVKCLHVLVAHSLGAGPGVNPFGDEALALLDDWSRRGPCVDPDDPHALPHKRTRSS